VDGYLVVGVVRNIGSLETTEHNKGHYDHDDSPSKSALVPVAWLDATWLGLPAAAALLLAPRALMASLMEPCTIRPNLLHPPRAAEYLRSSTSTLARHA